MPKRTNLHQAVIFYVKRHYAPPNVEVTESKMLFDPATAQDREVDIVMEGRLGDEDVCVSIEVVARSRPMGPEWVGSMIKKHERMSTTKLVLVSWSGFTAGAENLVNSQGGKVVSLTPQVLPNASVEAPHYMEVTTTPERISVVVRNDRGERVQFDEVPIDVHVHYAPQTEAYLCTLGQLVNRLINQQGRTPLLDQAYQHEHRSELTSFSFESTELDALDLYVLDLDSGEFQQISAIAVAGPISVHEQTMEFTVMKLGDSIFALSEMLMGGKPAVWVVTNSEQAATVSWRLI